MASNPNIEDVIIPAKIEFDRTNFTTLDEIQKKFNEISATYTEQMEAIKAADKSRGKTETAEVRSMIQENQWAIEKHIQKINELIGGMPEQVFKKKNFVYAEELEKAEETVSQRQAEINRLSEENVRLNGKRTAMINEVRNAEEQLAKTSVQQNTELERQYRTSKLAANAMISALSETIEKNKDSRATQQALLSEDKQRLASLQLMEKEADAENKVRAEGIKLERERWESINQEVLAMDELNQKTHEIVRTQEESNSKYQEMLEKTKALVRNFNETKSAQEGVTEESKQSTTQFYYMLRATKMLGDTIRRMQGAVDKIIGGLTQGVTTAAKAIAKMSLGMLGFAKHTKDAKKQHDGLNMSLKKGLKMILAYGLGLRSLFAIARRLRSYVSTGLRKMSIQFAYVNNQMSSTIASLNQMKASVATVVQPILNVLMPALLKLSALFTEVTVAIGSFFAALTGQKFVYKAVRAQYDYADSLDKSAGSAKKLNDEMDEMLGHYDELNVITKDDDKSGAGNGGGGGADIAPGYQYEEIPIDDQFQKAADKVKEIFEKIFDPLKKAWDEKGKAVLEAWDSMLSSIKGLIEAIGTAALDVWQEDASIQVWKDLLDIVTNILSGVSGLVSNFTAAWNEGDKGKRILEAIRDIIGIIVGGAKECSGAFAEWSKSIDFNPLLESTVGFLEKIKPLVQTITDLCVYFYKNVILPFRKYLIETGLPALLDKLGEIATKLNDALPVDKIKEFMNAFEPFLEKTWEALLIVLGDVGDAIAKIVGSEGFSKFIDLLIKWMNDADPETMAKGIEDIAKAIGILWASFKVIKVVVTVMSNIMTILNMLKQFGLITAIGNLLAPLGGLSGILSSLGAAIAPLLGPLGIVALGVALYELLTNMDKIADAIKNFGANFVSWVEDIGPKMAEAFGNIGKNIGKAIGKFCRKIWDGFQKIPEMDWPQIGLDILLGILDIFSAITKFIIYVTEAVENFFQGLWEGFCDEFIIDSPSKAMEPIGEYILKGILEGILSVVSGIGKWIKENVFDKFMNAVKTAFGIVGGIAKKFVEIGGNVISSVKKGLTDKFTALKDKIGGVFDKIRTKASTVLDKEKFAKFGSRVISGVKNGLSTGYAAVKEKVSKLWSKFKTVAESKGFPVSKYESFAKKALRAVKSGVSSGWRDIKANVKNVWSKLKDTAKSGLSKETFKNIGLNILKGLLNGIKAGWDFIKTSVTNIWNRVVGSAKDAFDQNSPSKVFAEIGEYNMEGLAEGMEDGYSDVEKDSSNMFNDLVNLDDTVDTSSLDTMSETLITSFTQLKDTITQITTEMATNVRDQISSMFDVETVAKLNDIADIKIPNIASGKALPTNGKFYVEVDNSELYSKLPTIIQDAMDSVIYSALERTMNISRKNQPIMLQLNGRQIAQVVWDESDKRYKQTGRRY